MSEKVQEKGCKSKKTEECLQNERNKKKKVPKLARNAVKIEEIKRKTNIETLKRIGDPYWRKQKISSQVLVKFRTQTTR